MRVLAGNAASPCWQAALRRLGIERPGEWSQWEGRSGRIAVSGRDAILVNAHGVALALCGSLRDGRGAGDLLAGYLGRGFDAFRGARGEFSFVLCDERDGFLSGGRDVLGGVGLAWCRRGRNAWFASSVIDLVRATDHPVHWNKTYLADWFLELGSQPQTCTAFAGIERCAPGEIIRLREGYGARHRFDEIRSSPDPGGTRPDVARFRDLLGRKVTRARGPSVLSLSGGVDSTVVALACADAEPVLHTMTYRAPGARQPCEDERRTWLLAHHPEVRPADVQVPKWFFTELWLDEWASGLPVSDDPPSDSPALLPARWSLYKAARDHGFSEVLDGRGGDEIFDLPVSSVDRKAFDSRFARATAQLLVGATPELTEAPEVHEALTAFRERLTLAHFRDRMVAVLTSAASESARSTADLLADTFGLRTASPLWDADVAELAARLDPLDRVDRFVEKPFLRAVLRAQGCDVECPRQVDQTYASVARRMAPAVAAGLPERLRRVDLLASWVDMSAFRSSHDNPGLMVRLYLGASWMSAVERTLSCTSFSPKRGHEH
jgi:asparagine synthetase B (glutamine-hydrolysing)